jgi:hypothetical protein
LQARLELRLQESYKTCMDLVAQMQETAEELKKELCFEHKTIQTKLSIPGGANQRSPSPGKLNRAVVTKASFDYQVFRVKFSLREIVREELFAQLQECNDRLEKLLTTSIQSSDVQNSQPASPNQIYAIETALKVAHRKSAALFKALEVAWNCSCLKHHLANLRLEHRTLSEACFEIILMSMAPKNNVQDSWTWREIQCGHMKLCASETANGTSSTRQQSAASTLQAYAVSYSCVHTASLILVVNTY